MRVFRIPLFLLSLLLVVAHSTTAQNCGCFDAGNCPVDIVQNTTSQVCYEITDAANNNLNNPDQGVCGVSLSFRHGNIGNVSMSLTAPDGTTIDLVNTSGNCSPFTVIGVWEILFVPCGEDCHPDTVGMCEYPCIFDTCPDDCNWGNAIYNGSYYPFSGCLEDFNSGTVNGQWCLNIDNDPSFNGGEVFDFEVILCDDTGIFCCDADAGSISLVPDILACEGAANLTMEIQPTYGAITPDPVEYGYTFVIAENDLIIDYQSDVDLISYPVGTYQVCGLSYLLTDLSNLPPTNSGESLADLREDLNSLTPSFCGNLTPNCFFVTISSPPPPTNLVESICEGDCFPVGDDCFTEAGNYSVILLASTNCDSVVNLELTILEVVTTNSTAVICQGDSIQVGDSTYFETGMFTTILETFDACDSIVELDLTVLPSTEITLTETICAGDSVQVGNSIYKMQGNFSDTLTSVNGCDSVVHLDLTVIELAIAIAPPMNISCNQPAILLDGTNSSTGTDIIYNWTTDTGTLLPPTNTMTATATTGGWYYFTLTSNGCTFMDSVEIIEDSGAPTINIIPPDTLNCAVTSVVVDASNTFGGDNLSFLWTSTTGQLIPNPTDSILTLFEEDSLLLVVSNEDNGCTASTTINIEENINPPISDAGPEGFLTCLETTLTLDGTASSPMGMLEFQWEGAIQSGANTAMSQINSAGLYTLIVTDVQNFCRDTATTEVFFDTLSPVAIITFPNEDSLTCDFPVLTLDGNSSAGQNLDFQWIGNVFPNNTTPLISLNEPGVFELIVENTTNGCRDTTSVLIEEDTTNPNADAGLAGELDCGTETYVLGGSSTSMGAGITYSWSTNVGSFITPTDIHNPTIDAAGTYLLIVTNTQNGCTASDMVTILEDDAEPAADAGFDGILTCDNPIFTLDATGTTLAGTNFNDTILFAFEWEALNHPDFHEFYAVIDINFPDTFIVHVTHGTSQCVDTDTVIVTANFFPPSIDAGNSVTLDCETGDALLSGEILTALSDFSINWTTPDGVVLLGENTLQPIVSGVGMYILEVIDNETNCSALDTAFAMIDTIACLPLVAAGQDSTIDCSCNCTEITVLASGSTGAIFDYMWTDESGMEIFPTDPFAPVLGVGNYTFTITNTVLNIAAFDEVSITIDTIRPILNIGDLLEWDCPTLASCTPLDVSNVPTGAQFSYEWDALDGTICSDLNALQAEVQGLGVYFLQVTNTVNHCIGSDAVQVDLLGTAPEADAGLNVQFECGDSTTILDCSNSSFGQNVDIEWFSYGGTIDANGTTCNPTVSIEHDQDTFHLALFDNQNFCTDTAAIVLFAAEDCFPMCSAGPNQTITCDTDTLTLEGIALPTDLYLAIQWEALVGNICGADTNLNVCINAPGIYQITVTRFANGAEFQCTDQVIVNADTLSPDVNAGMTQFITCNNDCASLQGSPTGINFSYQWTTTDGSFKNGETTPTALANAVGTYELMVTNLNNGCTNTDWVLVEYDTISPTALIGPDNLPPIDCDGNTLTLSASGSSNGTYTWTTMGGNFVTPPSGTTAQVNAAGTYCLTVTTDNGCTSIDCLEVLQDDDVPICNAGETQFLTCAIDQVMLIGTANPVAGVEFQWSGPGIITNPNNLTVTVNQPGIYELLVTKETNGCTCISSVEVVEDTEPPLIVAGNDVQINCENPAVILTSTGSQPTGNLIFEWFYNNTLLCQACPTFEANEAGEYVLVGVNNLNGCSASDTVLVTSDMNIPIAEAGLDTTLTCIRDEVILTASGSTTGSNILYTWQTPNGNIIEGAETATPLVNLEGLYYLTVLDSASNCEIIDSVFVTLDTLSPTALIDQSTLPTLTCSTTFVTLDGTPSGSVDSLIFKWSNNGTTPMISVIESGEYTLTVCHQRTGCTSTDAILVNIDTLPPPVQIASPPPLTCDATSVQLDATAHPNYTYFWNACDDFCETATPSISSPGVFSVTVTDAMNGCTNSASVLVEEDKTPPIAEATPIGMLDCIQETAGLSGEGSTLNQVIYEWTTLSNGNIFEPTILNTSADAPGWYFLTVTSLENGCTATDSTQITANAIPISDLHLSLDEPDCIDAEGFIRIDSVLGGTKPFVYSIDTSTFITYPQFSFLQAGLYDLQIEDASGCTFDTLIELRAPTDLSLELGEDQFINLGDSTTIQATLNVPLETLDTLFWSPKSLPNLDCARCLTQGMRPLETTTYRLTVLDENGCRAADKVTIFVNEALPMFVPNAFSPNGDNENERFFVYAGKGIQLVRQLKVFDRWGDLVFEVEDAAPNDPSFGWDGTFNGHVMNPQVLVWMVEIILEDGRVEVFWGDVILVH